MADSFEEFLDSGGKNIPKSNLAPKVRDFDEAKFQNWYKDKATKLNINPNPDDPNHFYDYRAAYVAGAEPDSTGHWPSTFKIEGHPRMVVDGVNTKTGEKTDSDDSFESYLDKTPSRSVTKVEQIVKAPKPSMSFGQFVKDSIGGIVTAQQAEAKAAIELGDAAKTLGTGFAAFIPAAGSMLIPTNEEKMVFSELAPKGSLAEKAGTQGKFRERMQGRLDRAREIMKFLTAEPTTEGGMAIVEPISKVFGFIPEQFTETANIYKKWGDEARKQGREGKAEVLYNAATFMDLGGEIVNLILLGQLSKIKNIPKSTWFRQLSVKEQGLVVSHINKVSDAIAADKMTAADMREIMKNGTTEQKDMLFRKYVFGDDFTKITKPNENPIDPRVKQFEQDRGIFWQKSLPGSKDVLYPGESSAKWYENTPTGIVPTEQHPVRQAVREAIAEARPIGLPAPPNLGEGFSVKPAPDTAVIRRPSYTVPGPTTGLEVEYKPVVRKDGTPFPSAETANVVAVDRGYKPGEFEVIPVEGGFGFRKVGQKPVMSNASADIVTNETRPDIVIDQERSKVDSLPEQAKQLGVEYTGNYEIPGKEPVPSFFDPQTKSNFALGKNETLEQAVTRHRDSFKEGEVTEQPVKDRVLTEQEIEAIGSESINDFLPASVGKLIPALRIDGKVYSGGLNHGEVLNEQVPREVVLNSENVESGYVDKNGKWLSDDEAHGLLKDKSSENKPVAELFNIESIKPFINEPNKAKPQLEQLGKQIYEEGKTDWFKWRAAMQEKLGEFYKPFKQVVAEVWKGIKKLVKEQKGSIQVAPDIEAVRAFVSKAQELVDKHIRQKMDVVQLYKTMQKKGLTTAERNILFGDLKGKVTPEQVKEAVKANTTEVKDVVFGGKIEYAPLEFPKTIEDLNIMSETYGLSVRSYNALKKMIEGTITKEEALRIMGRDGNKFVRPIIVEDQTYFKRWTEPGYKPESYREMFVTAPMAGNKKPIKFLDAEAAVIDFRNNTLLGDTLSVREWVRQEAELKRSTGLTIDEYDTYAYQTENWRDGHDTYSDIQNPIVRLRYNEREVNDKRILFIEEIQGPSDTNQAKMPAALRDRIYDIGVKRAIALAKEQGFDEIAWTTGKMQADRYNLTKYIDRIQVDKTYDGSYTVWGGKNGEQAVLHKENLSKEELPNVIGKELAAKALEQTEKSPDDVSRRRRFIKEKGDIEFKLSMLQEMAARSPRNIETRISIEKALSRLNFINSQLAVLMPRARLSGLDLEVGGEGLKRLYDETIPGLMEKYSKTKVQNTNLGGTAVKSVPITENTPSSFTLYNGLDVIAAVESLRKTVNDIKSAKPIVEDIGRRIFEGGKKKYFEWQKEFKEVVGEMWEKIKPIISDIWKSINNQRGQAEVGSSAGEFLKQRVIRKSEKSKIEKQVKNTLKIQEIVQKEIEDLSSPYREKKFENLKNRRIDKLEKEISRLEKLGSTAKAGNLKRAITAVKQRNLDTHLNKLRKVDDRLSGLVGKLEEKANTVFDKEDIVAPKLRTADVKFLNDLPDIEWKPLGGFFQNPIYTLEQWGREVKGGEKKVKELFVYPIRSANKRATEHFKKIHEKSQELEKSLPRGSSERIGKYALAQDPEGIKVLEKMKVEVPKLTPEEMQAYKWMRRGLELFHGYVNKGRAAAGLEPMGYVKNYFTLASEVSLAERLGFGMNDPYFAKYIHNKATSFTSALERTGGLDKVRLDSFNIFNEYIQSATKHMYLSPEIAKMREYLHTLDLGKGEKVELKKSHPRAARMLEDYLDFVVGQKKNVFSPGLESIIRFINDNNTIATLSASIRTPLIQPTALVNTYGEIGPRYVKEGIAGLMDKKLYEFALKESDHLLTREFDVNVTPITSGAIGRAARARQFVNQSWFGMKPTKVLDHATATATWIGAYKKGVEVDGLKFGSEEARRYADDVVIKTQGSAAKEDLAPIQRTNIGKFFSTFQTFVINNWNFLQKEIAGIKNSRISKTTSVHKAARILFATTLVNSIFEDGLGINSPLPAPVTSAKKAYDETDSTGRAGLAAALEMLQLVPGVGNLRYGSTVLGASSELLGDLSNKINSEIREQQGKDSDKEDVFDVLGFRDKDKSWIELGGKLAGIPGTGQAVRTGKILAKGGSLPEAIIGDYPENYKTVKRRLRKRYFNAVKNRDMDKARSIREEVLEWNRNAREDKRFDQMINLD